MSNKNRQEPWVIRTDFSDHEKWMAVCDLIAAPQTLFGRSFRADVQFISNENYARLECNKLVRSLPDDYLRLFCFVIDSTTLCSVGHPILVVGFSPKTGKLEDYQRTPKETPLSEIQTFRAIPSAIASIQINLALANMDFEDFARAVDDDGVYRGFPQ